MYAIKKLPLISQTSAFSVFLLSTLFFILLWCWTMTEFINIFNSDGTDYGFTDKIKNSLDLDIYSTLQIPSPKAHLFRNFRTQSTCWVFSHPSMKDQMLFMHTNKQCIYTLDYSTGILTKQFNIFALEGFVFYVFCFWFFLFLFFYFFFTCFRYFAISQFRNKKKHKT